MSGENDFLAQAAAAMDAASAAPIVAPSVQPSPGASGRASPAVGGTPDAKRPATYATMRDDGTAVRLMTIDELSSAFHEVHSRLVKSERFAQELHSSVDHNAQLLAHHVEKLKASEQASAVSAANQLRARQSLSMKSLVGKRFRTWGRNIARFVSRVRHLAC